MGSKASAVIYGEVKNSTQLDRFQLSWDPGQLQLSWAVTEQKGQEVEEEERKSE